MDLNQRILAELCDLESRGELRHLNPIHGVDLSSNDYLGLATHPAMKQAVIESVACASRVASTGSRLLSGHDHGWNRLEHDFAHWVGAEAALYFTSGYAANLGLLSALLQPGDIVFSDSANHASLIDGMRLAKCERVIFPHLDLNYLEDALRERASLPGARVVVVESVFSMEGDAAPLPDLVALGERFGAQLVVDEAHATGVRGPRGCGCVAEAGLSARVLATVHTCGKALAAVGAFVCGSGHLRRFLLNRARTFIFTTALPPYIAAQVSTGMSLALEADNDRRRLIGLGEFLRKELRRNGFDTGRSNAQIVPVILGDNQTALHAAKYLEARGFGVRAIRPPTVPAGAARLRLSLTARLSNEILARLVNTMAQMRSDSSPARAVSASS